MQVYLTLDLEQLKRVPVFKKHCDVFRIGLSYAINAMITAFERAGKSMFKTGVKPWLNFVEAT